MANANQEKRNTRDYKVIDGKSVRVKYKSFRLPLDLIKKMNVYAAEHEETLESIVYRAIRDYLNKRLPKDST